MSSSIILSRQPLATLGKLTVAALLGTALAFAILLLTILQATGIIILPLLIVTIALLICAFATLAICTGIGATVQNYRITTSQAPGWLPTPLAALGGFIVGAFVVALLVSATSQPSAVTASVNGTPAVHLGVSNFAQSTSTISKGSKLMLIDDGQFPHILQNGSWVNNTPRPATEPGAPAVQNLKVNGNSIEIGPFSTAGTFDIYCTIHPGMNLTIIVQ